MNRKPLLLVAVFAAAVLWPSLADAQIAPQGFSVGAVGGFESQSLETDEREYGPTGEAFVRYTFESGLQLVGGATFSSMNVDAVPDNRQVLSFWGEVRLVLSNWKKASPYFGMRGGYLHQSLSTTINAQPVDLSANGWIAAGTLGFLYRLVSTVALDGLLQFGFAGTSDLEADGEPVDRPTKTAWLGGLKLGLVISFPK